MMILLIARSDDWGLAVLKPLLLYLLKKSRDLGGLIITILKGLLVRKRLLHWRLYFGIANN
jgi:hypothetical protein